MTNSSLLLTTALIFFLGACQPKAPVTATDGNGNNAASTDPTTNPVVTPAPSPSPSPGAGPTTSTDASKLDDINLFTEVAEPMGQAVDAEYPSTPELMKIRNFNTQFAVDTCDPMVQGHDRFADRIAYAVFRRMKPMKIDVGSSVAPIFGLNSDNSTYLETGLLSHPFCHVSAATLQVTLQGKHVPSAEVIAKAQKFTDLLNQYRGEMLQGSREGKVKAYKLWSKFMMCVGYMESLTTADVTTSDRIASSLGFRRPAGVSFYNDSLQTDPDSILGIGIFQESNVVKWGDSYSCVTDWNRQFPSCPIDPNVSKTGMLPILGSTYQTFNAYCGASMITRMFGVQVNATRAKNTHPDNVLADGSLKAPADRCVSPFMNVNTSYNHFAPLQNGSGFTMDNILSCTLAEE